MAGYVRAKRRILRNQEADDWAIVGVDDAHGEKIVRQLVAANDRRVVPISATRRVGNGVAVVDGELIDDIDGERQAVGDLRAIAHLQGQHNWQNAAAAYAAARALGAGPEQIVRGMASFPGLAHRMELVAEIDGIRFINDSKATNPEAAARSLACYRPVYWIAGGQPKQDDLDALLPHLDRVRKAFLIGAAAERFEALLDGKVETVVSTTLDRAFGDAVAQARLDRLDGATVLLAPACASFDQFKNFEVRGDTFRTLVTDLRSPLRSATAGGGGGR
jgi:UDP-N-acetylmuramoylalanine--D-glutamate ligase